MLQTTLQILHCINEMYDLLGVTSTDHPVIIMTLTQLLNRRNDTRVHYNLLGATQLRTASKGRHAGQDTD